MPNGAGPYFGASLAQALRSRGLSCSDSEASRLADFLLDCIESGVLVADNPNPLKAVHGDAHGVEPSTGGRSVDPAGIGRQTRTSAGGRVAFAEGDAVVRRTRSEGPTAYNMGPSVCIDEDQS